MWYMYNVYAYISINVIWCRHIQSQTYPISYSFLLLHIRQSIVKNFAMKYRTLSIFRNIFTSDINPCLFSFMRFKFSKVFNSRATHATSVAIARVGCVTAMLNLTLSLNTIPFSPLLMLRHPMN